MKSWTILVLAILDILGKAQSQCDNEAFVSYSNNGQISIANSVVLCMQNVDDLHLYPFYQDDNILVVQSYIILNNLINIDSVTNTVELDFFWRVVWTDERLDMPALFSALNSTRINSKGIDITQLVGTTDVNQTTQPSVWYPDLFFPDASAISIGESFLKLNPGGLLTWSRHVTVSLIMSNFNYKEYPSDTQVIILRYLSYSYDTSLLRVNLADPAVTFFLNYEGVESFKQNTLWSFDEWQATIENQHYGVGITKSFAVIKLFVSRKPEGIILRLAVPIFILVLLSGCTFWAALESRVDSTVTLLLAVSALYIVIFQNIPMVGYTTDFDSFSISMFVILFLCVVTHQFVFRLHRKDTRWPIRLLIARVIEFLGRIFLLPTVCLIYYLTFSEAYTDRVAIATFTVIALGAGYISLREVTGLKSAAGTTFQLIEAKVSKFDSMSNLEVLIFNWYRYSVLSTSLRHHATQRKKERPSSCFPSVDEDVPSSQQAEKRPTSNGRDITHNPVGEWERDREIAPQRESNCMFAL